MDAALELSGFSGSLESFEDPSVTGATVALAPNMELPPWLKLIGVVEGLKV